MHISDEDPLWSRTSELSQEPVPFYQPCHKSNRKDLDPNVYVRGLKNNRAKNRRFCGGSDQNEHSPRMTMLDQTEGNYRPRRGCNTRLSNTRSNYFQRWATSAKINHAQPTVWSDRAKIPGVDRFYPKWEDVSVSSALESSRSSKETRRGMVSQLGAKLYAPKHAPRTGFSSEIEASLAMQRISQWRRAGRRTLAAMIVTSVTAPAISAFVAYSGTILACGVMSWAGRPGLTWDLAPGMFSLQSNKIEKGALPVEDTFIAGPITIGAGLGVRKKTSPEDTKLTFDSCKTVAPFEHFHDHLNSPRNNDESVGSQKQSPCMEKCTTTSSTILNQSVVKNTLDSAYASFMEGFNQVFPQSRRLDNQNCGVSSTDSLVTSALLESCLHPLSVAKSSSLENQSIETTRAQQSTSSNDASINISRDAINNTPAINTRIFGGPVTWGDKEKKLFLQNVQRTGSPVILSNALSHRCCLLVDDNRPTRTPLIGKNPAKLGRLQESGVCMSGQRDSLLACITDSGHRGAVSTARAVRGMSDISQLPALAKGESNVVGKDISSAVLEVQSAIHIGRFASCEKKSGLKVSQSHSNGNVQSATRGRAGDGLLASQLLSLILVPEACV